MMQKSSGKNDVKWFFVTNHHLAHPFVDENALVSIFFFRVLNVGRVQIISHIRDFFWQKIQNVSLTAANIEHPVTCCRFHDFMHNNLESPVNTNEPLKRFVKYGMGKKGS